MTRRRHPSKFFSSFSILLTTIRRAAMRLAAAAGLIGLTAAGALAQTTPSYVVTTASDDATGVAGNCPSGGGGANCTLRDALAASAASSGGNITFDPTTFGTAQTISLSNTLVVPTNTTITGPGAALLTVSGNSAVQVVKVGSGVTASMSGLTIAHGLINTSTSLALGDGGGIFNAGTLSLSSCVVTENEVSGAGDPGQGGGIYNSGTLTIDRCTFSNNVVASSIANHGGALLNGGTAKVTNSTFSANTAVGGEASPDGGAIYNYSTLTLINSTISGNQISDSMGGGNAHGGGIYNSGTLSVDSSTISGNSQATAYHGDSGGGIYSSGGCALSNTILAGSTDANGTAPDGSGVCTSGSNNLIGNGTGLTGFTNGVNGDLVGTPASPLNAQLAPLANYGGPTQTMIPLPGSSAICAGSAVSAAGATLTTDQRGVVLNLNSGNASTYTGAGGYCPAGSLDVGAVQTDYAMSFNPVSSTVGPPETGTIPGIAMSPAPQVAVTENGTPFAGSASINLTDGDAKLASTPASASTSGGAATFNGLVFNGTSSSDALTSTLSLNPALTTPVSLTAESASFSVEDISSNVAITCGSGCGPNPGFGATLSYIAMVSPTNTAQGTPTGSITFSIDSGLAVGGSAAACPDGSPADSVCSTYSSANLSAGPHTLEAIFTGNGVFQSGSGSQMVAVVAAPTTIVTPPTASGVNAGQTLGSSTLNGGSVVSAITNTVVSGTWSFVNPLSTVLNATGPQPVVFTPSSSNYAAPGTASVTVTAATFAIAASPASGSVKAGQSAQSTITITPAGGFNQRVSFSCAGLPAEATCSFTPSTVTPSGSPATTSLTIATAAQSSAVAGSVRSGRGSTALALVTGGFFMLFRIRTRLRGSIGLRLGLILALIAAAVVGCGGGGYSAGSGAGATARTYTVTVTGTAGSMAQTANLSLTVQ